MHPKSIFAFSSTMMNDLPEKMSLESMDVVAIDLEEGGVRAERVLDTAFHYTDRPATLPDILGTLQNETQMTRISLVKILFHSGRLEEFSINPQAFVSMATACINKAMHAIMLTGIAYEEIAGSFWEMRRLEEEAERGITRYLDNLYKVQHEEKTIYDYVNFESGIERSSPRNWTITSALNCLSSSHRGSRSTHQLERTTPTGRW